MCCSAQCYDIWHSKLDYLPFHGWEYGVCVFRQFLQIWAGILFLGSELPVLLTALLLEPICSATSISTVSSIKIYISHTDTTLFPLNIYLIINSNWHPQFMKWLKTSHMHDSSTDVRRMRKELAPGSCNNCRHLLVLEAHVSQAAQTWHLYFVMWRAK